MQFKIKVEVPPLETERFVWIYTLLSAAACLEFTHPQQRLEGRQAGSRSAPPAMSHLIQQTMCQKIPTT
ncbi:uncharacterized protein DMAD_06983 [Drosophila madeirensis]|uniref:Uncharacterized protein n=1 Tax=Drosophila madeirensis TaxID=30013 RepID=A0AAU9FTJ9_DROMD